MYNIIAQLQQNYTLLTDAKYTRIVPLYLCMEGTIHISTDDKEKIQLGQHLSNTKNTILENTVPHSMLPSLYFQQGLSLGPT